VLEASEVIVLFAAYGGSYSCVFAYVYLGVGDCEMWVGANWVRGILRISGERHKRKK
jgi:hypothetical protein